MENNKSNTTAQRYDFSHEWSGDECCTCGMVPREDGGFVSVVDYLALMGRYLAAKDTVQELSKR